MDHDNSNGAAKAAAEFANQTIVVGVAVALISAFTACTMLTETSANFSINSTLRSVTSINRETGAAAAASFAKQALLVAMSIVLLSLFTAYTAGAIVSVSSFVVRFTNHLAKRIEYEVGDVARAANATASIAFGGACVMAVVAIVATYISHASSGKEV